MLFLVVCRLFFKINLFKNLFQEHYQCQTVYIIQSSVGPDLGPNCLQRLSVDDISKQRVKVGVVYGKMNYGP